MNSTVRRLRTALQSVDRQLIILLGKRFKLVEELGTIKKTLDMPVEDQERETELSSFYELVAKQQKSDPAIVEAVFKSIRKESKRLQKDLRKKS